MFVGYLSPTNLLTFLTNLLEISLIDIYFSMLYDFQFIPD